MLTSDSHNKKKKNQTKNATKHMRICVNAYAAYLSANVLGVLLSKREGEWGRELRFLLKFITFAHTYIIYHININIFQHFI